jgi:amino acid transporter
MNITPIAGEVKNPQRNLPLALLAGTGIVMFLYVGANVAYHLVIPMDTMATASSPTVTVFFLRLLGATGAVLASAALMISVFGALNGNLMVGPRLLFAMGEDRLAPAALSAVHPRWHTPVRAIGIMAAWACLLILLAAAVQANVEPLPADTKTEDKTFLDVFREKPLFDVLTDFSMFGAVIFETLAVSTIFVFRRTMPNAERPYRCLGYPVVPLLYLILPAYILANIFLSEGHRLEAIIGTAFIGLGIAVYGMFLRSPVKLR